MERLEQKKFAKGSIALELIGDGRLKVTRSSISEVNEEIFNLFDLDYKYDKYLNRPIKFIVMSLLIAAPAAIFIRDAINTMDYVPLIYSLIFLIPSLGFLYSYLWKKTDIIVFRYRHNARAAFTLWNHTSNSEDLSDFLSRLSKKIEDTKISPEATVEQKLEIFKDTLEFLLRENVLTIEEAETALARTRNRLISPDKAKIFAIPRSNI